MLTLATWLLQEKTKAPVPLGRKLMDCGDEKPASTVPLKENVPSAASRRIPRLFELAFAVNASRPSGLAATLIGPNPPVGTEPVSVKTPVGEILSTRTTVLLKAFTRTLLVAVTVTPCAVTGRKSVLAMVLNSELR